MIFTPLPLGGACLVRCEPREDERGYYMRTWCAREFRDQGLSDRFVESGASYNRRRGTLRGLHFQAAPHAQAKLVRCIRGAVYDVIVDLRRDSPTYLRWVAVELSSHTHTMLYVPEGFAHGFQTLAEDTELLYQMTDFYCPAAERGIRWNDPTLGIQWPLTPAAISARDAGFADFQP